MHLIVGERQQGHTTRLIKMSADGKGTIVTATKRSAEYVKNQAKEMGLDIPKPINWEMFIHSYMMKTGPFLLDELGVILSNYGITTATIDTGGSIENLSEMQSHYGDELAAQIREITTDYNSLSDFEKFVLDNGYRYTTHEELRDGYNRHWKAAHDVLITMEEFLAEAEKELGDPAADVYEVLVRLVEEKKLKPGDLLGYAHYHWCLDKPEAMQNVNARVVTTPYIYTKTRKSKTEVPMSKEYDEYLKEHRSNVCCALEWLKQNLPEVVEGADGIDWYVQYDHDRSKDGSHEYEAYDNYFYGNNQSYAAKQEFQKAWLHHIHCNPHHWQHWVLVNDDPEDGTVCLEMPYHYIVEMICDWWSFSWAKDDLTEIFGWYDEHRENMLLAKNTRKTVEDILSKMAEKLDYQGELWHHGIKGQKWGVQNGPPYPLGDGDKSAEERKANNDISTRPLSIPKSKFENYALNPEKDENKAKAFRTALGYTKDNCQQLIKDVQNTLNRDLLVEKGDGGYGMRYEQVMRLKGPNGKEANVLTAWIDDGNELRLTTIHITRKKETK